MADDLKLAMVVSAVDEATAVIAPVVEAIESQAAAVDAVQVASVAAAAAQSALGATVQSLEGAYAEFGEQSAVVADALEEQTAAVDAVQVASVAAATAQSELGATVQSLEGAYAKFGDQSSSVASEMVRLNELAEALGPAMLTASKELGFGIEKTEDGGLDLVRTLSNIEGKFGSLKDMSPQVAAQLQKAFGGAGFKALTSMSKETVSFSQRMAKAGEVLRTARENLQAFADMAKAAIGSLLEASADVDGAMASLAQSTKLLGDNEVYDAAKANALAWSSAHAQSSADYIHATKLMVAADHSYAMTSEQTFAATAAAMRLAASTQGEASVAAQTLIAVYAQVGDKSADTGEEFGRLSDQLARLAQLFPSVNVTELADPLKDVLPTARAAKVSFEQVAVALGRFNEMGIKGGEAGAAVSSMIAAMGPASEKLGFAVAKTADGGMDLVATLGNVERQFGPINSMAPETAAKLQEVFGGDAWRGLTMMSGQTQALADSVQSLGESAGAAAAAQAEFEGTTAAQAQIAQQQFDAIKVTLAAGLLPAIQELLPIVTDLANRFAAFAQENPELISMVGTALVFAAALGSIVGPILSIGGAVVSLLGILEPLIAFAVANPIVLAVLAIVAVVALIYTYWEPISDFFVALWDGIAAVWGGVLNFFVGVFDEVKGAFQESFVGGLAKVLELLSPVTWFVRAFAALWPWLKAVGPQIWDGLVGGLVVLSQLHVQLSQWMLGGLASLLRSLVGWVSGVGAALVGGFKAAGALLWQGVQNDMGRVMAWLRAIDLTEVGRNIVGTITSGIKAMASAPYDAMLAIVQKMRNLLPFSPAKEGPFMDLDQVKIVETVAAAVTPAPLVDAMTDVTAQSMRALTAVPVPEIVMPTLATIPAAVASQSSANRNAGGGGNVTVQVIVQGGSDADLKRQIADAIKKVLDDPANAPKVARLANLGNDRTEKRKVG